MLPAKSTAMPQGLLNVAIILDPFAAPTAPLPAIVFTTPNEVIFLIRLLPLSAIYKLPEASIAIPAGLLKLANDPMPFAEPLLVLPAIVVTAPLGVTFLIRLLPLSAIYKFPAASATIAAGPLKLAAKPVLSAEPAKPLPANVVVNPNDDAFAGALLFFEQLTIINNINVAANMET